MRIGETVAELDTATKRRLESLLGMRGGYVLDFSNDTFADFVRTSVGFDPYEKYSSDRSKAKLLRQIWREEPSPSVAKLNLDLLEHWQVSKFLAGETPSAAEVALHQELVDYFAHVQTTDACRDSSRHFHNRSHGHG